MASTIAIVVTPDVGGALPALADRLHVWLADTPANRSAADHYRRSHATYSPERGVTVFRIESEESPADQVLRILGDVELHHGEYSQFPAWEAIEIYGAEANPEVREALAELGAAEWASIPGGVRFMRSAESAA